jgi:hypothetical protein
MKKYLSWMVRDRFVQEALLIRVGNVRDGGRWWKFVHVKLFLLIQGQERGETAEAYGN